MVQQKPLIVIVGPTSVGKTELGIELAKALGGEIISGDSMQVYKHMDIGTAKPTKEEMQGIPHYMLDILEPNEPFSVAIFKDRVEGYIEKIYAHGKIPLLVGGTGLYIRSIIDPYDFSPSGGNDAKRKELTEIAAEKGNEELVRMLKEVDPEAAKRIHINDTRRLIRALEVFHMTGKPISEFQYADRAETPKYNLAYYGLTMDRPKLYHRIEQRVDKMIENGLISEVERLLKMGFSPNCTSMQAIGYKEIIEYFNETYTLSEATEIIKRNTRHFAKRQLTWFRPDTRIRWKDVERYSKIKEIAAEIKMELEGQFTKT